MPTEKKITRLNSDYMQQYDAHMERRKRKKQRLIRRLVLFSVITVLAIGSMTVYHINQRALQADKKAEYEELQEQLKGLKAKEEDYLEEIKLLNDEEYVLEIARTNYFFSKKGELIFKIPDEKPTY